MSYRMKTNFELMRDRLLTRAGLAEPKSYLKYEDLAKSEWSPTFERYMRNRLIMGALRYGRLHGSGKPKYDRVTSMQKRLTKYANDGNKEHLVDVANLCLMEFEECHHPKAHFGSIDDGEHVGIKSA